MGVFLNELSSANAGFFELAACAALRPAHYALGGKVVEIIQTSTGEERIFSRDIYQNTSYIITAFAISVLIPSLILGFTLKLFAILSYSQEEYALLQDPSLIKSDTGNSELSLSDEDLIFHDLQVLKIRKFSDVTILDLSDADDATFHRILRNTDLFPNLTKIDIGSRYNFVLIRKEEQKLFRKAQVTICGIISGKRVEGKPNVFISKVLRQPREIALKQVLGQIVPDFISPFIPENLSPTVRRRIETYEETVPFYSFKVSRTGRRIAFRGTGLTPFQELNLSRVTTGTNGESLCQTVLRNLEHLPKHMPQLECIFLGTRYEDVHMTEADATLLLRAPCNLSGYISGVPVTMSPREFIDAVNSQDLTPRDTCFDVLCERGERTR